MTPEIRRILERSEHILEQRLLFHCIVLGFDPMNAAHSKIIKLEHRYGRPLDEARIIIRVPT